MIENVKYELEIMKDSVLKAVPATAIYLFGSHAYGEPNSDSDLDIYVVVPKKEMCSRDMRVNIVSDFHKKSSRYMSVDLLVGDEENFNNRARFPTLERKIYRDGVKIYG